MTYGRQFAAMGVAALVVDVFGARRDMAASFIDRLLNITEAMFLADAYAGLDYLAARPDVDPQRIVLMGFSYGAMATVFAAYEQVAEAFSPGGLRFAGHIALYGPCVAHFEDNRATGAPVLMMIGELDEITTPERCRETAAELRAGGAAVDLRVLEGAYHQWDGGFEAPRRIGRTMANCRFTVKPDGRVRDQRTGLAMNGPLTRKIVLGLCTGGQGYMIGADPAVRAVSNKAVSGFLNRLWAQS